MNELGIGFFRPTPRSWIELVRTAAHSNRVGDAFGIEISFAPILAIETGDRKRRVRQPGDRDVVEDVVARKAFWFAVKNACNHFIAACVVIKELFFFKQKTAYEI